MSTDLDLERFYQINDSGKPIPNRSALTDATDAEYFAVMPDAVFRVRNWETGDGAPVLSKPQGMKAIVFVDCESRTIALYFVDQRLRLVPGVEISEVLLLPPNRWSQLTRHWSGLDNGAMPPVLVPFVPN